MPGPLRDDHDAALARADALQVELDQQRRQDATLEAELAAARQRLAAAEAELAQVRPRPARRTPSSAKGARAVVVFGLTCGIIAAIASSASHEAADVDIQPIPPPMPIGAPPLLPAVAPPAALDGAQLVAEGLAMRTQHQQLARVAVEHVHADGSLDPALGRVEVQLAQPAAPSESGGPTVYGTTWAWDLTGWHDEPIVTPVAGAADLPPACTLDEILSRAKAEGAPPGTATITAHPEHGAWRWTYAADGAPEAVVFGLELDDSCAP